VAMMLNLLPAALAAALCAGAEPGWNAAAAAAYLDQRAAAWIERTAALNDSRAGCISCHTSLPYLLARPALRAIGVPDAAVDHEISLLDPLKRLVRAWDSPPYYPARAPQSRGTQAILFALLLARQDRQAGRDKPSPDTESAFLHLWSEQARSGPNAGAWEWLQFDLDPWETPEAAYFGAALAAVAIGSAPGGYSARADIQNNVVLLLDFLRSNRDGRTLHGRLPLLWAAAGLPRVLPEPERTRLLDEIRACQNEDGGWSIVALGPWKPRKEVALVSASDAYATAFTTFILQQSGFNHRAAEVARAVGWLKAHQDQASGAWKTESLNKIRKPDDPAKNFMTDAATAYAALVLSR